MTYITENFKSGEDLLELNLITSEINILSQIEPKTTINTSEVPCLDTISWIDVENIVESETTNFTGVKQSYVLESAIHSLEYFLNIKISEFVKKMINKKLWDIKVVHPILII